MSAHFRIVSIGKVSEKYVKIGEQEYLKRLRREAKFEFVEIPTNKLPESPAEVARTAEGNELLKKITPGEYFIALAERGKEFTSIDLADHLADLLKRGTSRITFGIGGAYGWDDKVLKGAHEVLSLSRLTFPRQMTRLILVEQLYRAMTIIRGLPYHK